jgi:hypothetical protein
MNDRYEGAPAPEGPRRNLNPYVPVAIVLVLFVLVAGVIALTAFRNRGAAGNTAWTPPAETPAGDVALTATASALAQAGTTVTSTVGHGATRTLVPTFTATATPADETPTPAVSPTPAASSTVEAVTCTEPVTPELAALYSQPELGCATGKIAVVWAAWEPFEGGAMLWREDNNQSYVLVNDGTWEPITEPWNGQVAPGRGTPPAGRVTPERGFGWVWGTRDDIFRAVGWPTDREKGFCAAIQPFERGFLLRSANVPSCTPDGLYNFATEGGWKPLALAIYKGGWRANEAQN